MERIDIGKLTYVSYIKLACLIFSAVGIVAGCLLLLVSFFYSDLYIVIGDLTYRGWFAGVVYIIISPFVSLAIGLVGSILSYLPFKLYFKFFKKIKIYGSFEGYLVQEYMVVTNGEDEVKNETENDSEQMYIEKPPYRSGY
jgi:hypothetical protein